LKSGIIVDREDEWGRGVLGGSENIAIEQAAFDAPAAADLDSGQFSALKEVVDSGKWDAQIGGRFFYRQKLWQGIGHEECGESLSVRVMGWRRPPRDESE
jgi:hypothetical protein